MAAIPGSSFPSGMPGEPNPYGSPPRATGGTVQPRSPRGPKLTAPKTVNVKAHTRVIKPKTTGGTPAIDPTTKSLIDAAVRLKFGGQEQGINQQLQQNARFTSGAPTWYQQAIQQIQAQAQPVPQNAMPAPTGDPATDSRNAAAYGFQQQRNNALTAGNTFLTNVGAGLTAAQGNTLNAANAQRQGLLSQQTQLKGTEGDFRTTTLAALNAAQQKADQANQDYQLKLGIAQDNNLIKTQTLDYLNRDRSAKNQIARTNSQTARINSSNQVTRTRNQQQQQGVNNALKVGSQAEKALVDAQKLKGKPTAGKITRPVRNRAETDWTGAQAMIRNVYGTQHFRPQDVADQLATSKHSIDHDIALAAGQMVKNARMGLRGIDDPKLAHRLIMRFGLHVPVVKQSPKIGKAVGNVLSGLPGQ